MGHDGEPISESNADPEDGPTPLEIEEGEDETQQREKYNQQIGLGINPIWSAAVVDEEQKPGNCATRIYS